MRYGRENSFEFASETLEARGIMHAFKIAHAHLQDIKKTANTQDLFITQIKEVEPQAEQ